MRDRFRPPGAGLHRRVVGHHHDLAPLDHAETGDHPGGRGLTLVLVVRDQESDLEPGAAGIQQLLDPLAGCELPLLVHLRDAFGSPALPQPGGEREVLIAQGAQTRGPGDGLGGGHLNQSLRCSAAQDWM